MAFTNYQLISKIKSTIESPIKEKVSDILNIVNALKYEMSELKTSIAKVDEKAVEEALERLERAMDAQS